MALYAFDGTGNTDEELAEKDTNVVRFKELYSGADVEYLEGVGTRWKAAGKVLGGLFGVGGRTRIDEMYDDLCANWRAGDRDIDIIGFSRGAALALHFANKISGEGIRTDSVKPERVPIRFLGLWDVVGSFGLSFNNILHFQEINLGWEIDHVASCVQHCFHAMALDERREAFGVTRLNADHTLANVQELWFRGVHSDVGGGNRNTGRSNIALNWMLDRAVECGVPIDPLKRKKPKYAQIDLAAKISENKDIQRDERRRVLPGDAIHPTAEPVRLAVDESHTSTVFSELKYNWSGVMLEAGCTYRFIVSSGERWKDGDIEECGPDGWSSKQLPWYRESIVEAFEHKRRHPRANWFEIIGALGDEDDHLLRILSTDYTFAPEQDAELYYFANDITSMYDNNTGSIRVTVKRIG